MSLKRNPRKDRALLADWGRLEALAREVEAATVNAPTQSGKPVRDWSPLTGPPIEGDYGGPHGPVPGAPDPDYTPAVRRVVRHCPGWDVERESKQEAYEWAARSRMHADGCHTSASTQRFRRRSRGLGLGYYIAVMSRLASLLRHWDEKAGHR